MRRRTRPHTRPAHSVRAGLRPFRLLGVLALLAAFALLLYQFALFVMVLMLNVRNPDTSAVMDETRQDLTQARQTRQQTRHQPNQAAPPIHLQHEWVDYAAISPHLKRAVVAAEDANFTRHGGVQWDAIKRAWQYNRSQAAQGQGRRRGGSTISQQLAKNLFLSNSRSYWRKGQELILTWMLEAVLSKERILELYLNFAQWGQTVFGAQAAARHYFKTDASRLSAAQAARLAAMLPSPAYYDRQGGNTPYLRQRTHTLMQRMRQVAVP